VNEQSWEFPARGKQSRRQALSPKVTAELSAHFGERETDSIDDVDSGAD